jgi:hypothetical protein
LAEKLESLTSKSKKPEGTPEPASSGFSTPAAYPKKIEQLESRGQYMQSETKKLSAIMKTELLADKSAEEIKLVSQFFIYQFQLFSSVLNINL